MITKATWKEMGDSAWSGDHVLFETNGSSLLASTEKVATKETFDAYNQHFLVINNRTNKPLAFVPYRITLSDGRTFEGVSDDEGKTELVSAGSPLNANIEVFA